MNNAYIVTGTLINEYTVTLDEALPIELDKVRLLVEPVSPLPQQTYQDVITAIRKRQQTRGYQPPTRQEIEAYLKAERDSWEV